MFDGDLHESGKRDNWTGDAEHDRRRDHQHDPGILVPVLELHGQVGLGVRLLGRTPRPRHPEYVADQVADAEQLDDVGREAGGDEVVDEGEPLVGKEHAVPLDYVPAVGLAHVEEPVPDCAETERLEEHDGDEEVDKNLDHLTVLLARESSDRKKRLVEFYFTG